MSKDIADIICESIDTIVQKRLEGLSYDKTVLCVIENISNRDKGEYVVFDGSTRFTAYSNVLTYREGNSVYVTIPNGDYNSQKIITGKYINNESESFTWVSPMETYVNLSGNIVDNGEYKELGLLLANKTEVLEKELFSRTFEKDNYVQTYNRMGISAEFLTQLNEYKTVSGSYGLRIELTCEEATTSANEKRTFNYIVYLDSSDMWGNPYNFEGYFLQEKVFDVSSIGLLKGYKVYFYQNNDFINAEGKPIPHTFKGPNGEPEDIMDNLYVKNIHISFGDSIDNLKDEKLYLTTPSAMTYAAAPANAAGNIEQNKKIISLQWAHKAGNTFAIIDNNKEIEKYFSSNKYDVSIKWYRRYLENGVNDVLAGNFWKEEILEQKNSFSYSFYPNVNLPNERIKVIIDVFDKEAFNANEKLDDKEKKSEENFHTYYYSDIIEFTNESNTELQNVDLIKALTISLPNKSDYNGVFRIYDNETKKLINSSERYKKRILQANYNSLLTGEDFLDGAENISWFIPLNNTMIEKPTLGTEYSESYEYEEVDGYAVISRVIPKLTDTKSNETEVQTKAQQLFRIKEYYSPSASNNTIKCKVRRNNLEYTAELQLFFGPSGTMGTDHTIDFRITDLVELSSKELEDNSIKWTEEKVVKTDIAALPFQLKENEYIKVEAYLYDHENKIVDNTKFNFSWLVEQDKMTTVQIGNNFYIAWKPKEEAQSEDESNNAFNGNYSIDSILIASTGNLKAYLPIPSKNASEVDYMEGATTVIYDSYGSNPSYYKKPYKLYKDGEEVSIDSILISSNNNSTDRVDLNFKPAINNNILKPSNLYIGDIGTVYYIIINKGQQAVWYQPLYISQNRYSSSMLNSWDGELKIDENGNSIFAALIGAGKKNSDNTFSGVLLGDVREKTDALTKTGLYGYHNGALSFGLLEDGTAFFGKSGNGRIFLNGDEATLSSADGKMIIDLDGGYIEAPNWRINADGSAWFKNIKASNETKNSSLDWGNGFNVNTSGILTANGCHINGDGVFSGTIYASAGSFSGSLSSADATIGGVKITSDNGILQIPAANMTGKLTATQIDATNLHVKAANIDGTLTADKIDATDLVVSNALFWWDRYGKQMSLSGGFNEIADAIKQIRSITDALDDRISALGG